MATIDQVDKSRYDALLHKGHARLRMNTPPTQPIKRWAYAGELTEAEPLAMTWISVAALAASSTSGPALRMHSTTAARCSLGTHSEEESVC